MLCVLNLSFQFAEEDLVLKSQVDLVEASEEEVGPLEGE